MEYRLIKTPEQFLIVSNEEIKNGDVYYHLLRNTIHSTREQADYFVNNTKYDDFKKVIGQQDQIDFTGLSEEEWKEIGWFDVEGLSELALRKFLMTHPEENLERNFSMFKEGYKICLQQLLSDRRFTLEDMEKAWEGGINEGSWKKGDRLFTSYGEFIESLSQQKSWIVELEMLYNVFTNGNVSDLELKVNGLQDVVFSEPKVTNGKVKILKIL